MLTLPERLVFDDSKRSDDLGSTFIVWIELRITSSTKVLEDGGGGGSRAIIRR